MAQYQQIYNHIFGAEVRFDIGLIRIRPLNISKFDNKKVEYPRNLKSYFLKGKRSMATDKIWILDPNLFTRIRAIRPDPYPSFF